MDSRQKRIAAMVRVALTKAQRLSRYQSLRMDLPKSTGRFFAIPASRSRFFLTKALGWRTAKWA